MSLLQGSEMSGPAWGRQPHPGSAPPGAAAITYSGGTVAAA